MFKFFSSESESIMVKLDGNLQLLGAVKNLPPLFSVPPVVAVWRARVVQPVFVFVIGFH